MTVVIRAAEEADLETLNAIAFRSKAYWQYDAEFMRAAQALLDLTPVTIALQPVFLAEVDGHIAGFYALRPWRLQPTVARAMELDYLFIDPPYIGQSIGRQLYDHAASVARAMGYQVMIIIADPNAEGFYARMGAERFDQVASDLDANRMLPLMRMPLV